MIGTGQVVSLSTHPPFVRRPAARISARYADTGIEEAQALARMAFPADATVVTTHQLDAGRIGETGTPRYATHEVALRKLGAYLVGAADTNGQDMAASREQLDYQVERLVGLLTHPDGYPLEGRRVLPFDLVVRTGVEMHTRARECGWSANGTYTPPRYHVGPLVGEQERRVARG